MRTIEINNRKGELIYSHTCKDNTVKATLLEAIREGIREFRDIDFSECDFSEYDFSECYFSRCDFFGCNFSGCDFSECDFFGCNFSGCDFSECDFSVYTFTRYLFSLCDFSACDFENSRRRGLEVKKMNPTKGLYKYITNPIITTDNKYYVELGCHIRTVEEWEADFWNNPTEFPNDGSEESNMRYEAFLWAKNWINENK